MPLPRGVARFNRYGTNKVTRRFAGTLPPFAMVIHRGRRSGREYHTPLFAFPCDNVFVIALTYGRDTDWERNVRAGGGELVYRRRTYWLGQPEAVGPGQAGRCLPTVVRLALRALRVDAFLAFPAAPAAPFGDSRGLRADAR